jgi:hypothetical protein
VVDEHLGFVFKPTESRTVDDAIPVPFEGRTIILELLGMLPAEAEFAAGRITGQIGSFHVFLLQMNGPATSNGVSEFRILNTEDRRRSNHLNVTRFRMLYSVSCILQVLSQQAAGNEPSS